MGIPFSIGPILEVVPFAAYSRIEDPGPGAVPDTLATESEFETGSGVSFGVNANVELIGNLFSLSGKVERRLFGANFTGSYFGPVYETNKFGFQQGARNAVHPFQKANRSTGQNGTFGALYGHILNSIQIGGSLQIPDRIERDTLGRVQQGTSLRLEARMPDAIPNTTVNAVYNRSPLGSLSDALVLDENSNLDLRVGYKFYPFLLVGTNYRWTFARVKENGREEVKATSHIFPFVALQISFDDRFGSGN